MKVLVIGGTGFIGSNLIDLVPKGALVTVMSRSLPPTKKMKPNICYVVGDVAAYKFKRDSFTHVIYAADGNWRSVRNVFRCKPERLLLISSGAAYYPGSDYSDKKIECEIITRTFKGTIARCFSFIGPHLQLDGRFAAGNFIRDAIKDQKIVIKGNGRAIRSYMSSLDMSQWLWTLLFKGAPGAVYNVGSPTPISMLTLAKYIADDVSKKIGKSVTVEVQNKRHESLAPDRYVPIIKDSEFGPKLRARISVREAIDIAVDWALAEVK